MNIKIIIYAVLCLAIAFWAYICFDQMSEYSNMIAAQTERAALPEVIESGEASMLYEMIRSHEDAKQQAMINLAYGGVIFLVGIFFTSMVGRKKADTDSNG